MKGPYGKYCAAPGSLFPYQGVIYQALHQEEEAGCVIEPRVRVFNMVHVFSISGKRRRGDSPTRPSVTCLHVSEDIGKAEAMATASKRQAAGPGKYQEGGLKTDFLISFPGEDGLSPMWGCSGRVSQRSPTL